MATGAESALYLGQNVQKRYQIHWKDGRTAVLVVGQAGQWLPFYATFITESNVHTFIVDNTNIYRAFLEAALPYLAGQTNEPPVAMHELMETELAALAAEASRLNGGGRVFLSDIPEGVHFDGKEFAHSYRLSKYPTKK